MKHKEYINNIIHLFVKKLNKLIPIFIVILATIISNYYFIRIDLTNEKKYSISDNTKKLTSDIDDIIYFKVFLHGNLPPQYQKLANEFKYILYELKAYSDFIEFEFIDPSSIQNSEYRLNLQKELYNKGILPIPHRNYENNKMEETWIFPGFTATYKSKEISMSLIAEILSNNSDEIIKKSIENLEFSLMSTIKKLTTKKQKIGLISGHGENTNEEIQSFKNNINNVYQLIELEPIDGQLNALDKLDCIIINNPINFFTEKDKFIIDQFIMNGGKAIWILNGTNANMDSLEKKSQSVVMSLENRNLNDMLFHYGIRVNYDIIQDLQAASIPIVTHYIKEKPQWTFFPWTFFPVSNGNKDHIISRNINPVKLHFASSIDIINNGLKPTVLLETTNKTNKLSTPAIINLESLKNPPNEVEFIHGKKNIAVLIEGVFSSVFTNRIPIEIQNSKTINFKQNSELSNKMVVISDGHFIKNQFLKGDILPLGFDKHTGLQYGNGTFILNTIDYLLNNEMFIKVRSKNIELRLLNQSKIKIEKSYWQFFNLLSPMIMVLIIGLLIKMRRKYKYQKT